MAEDVCPLCKKPVPSDYQGICPHCGKKIIVKQLAELQTLKDSIDEWTIRKFIQSHPKWTILSFILTVSSPFVGYYWAGLTGLGAGLLLGLAAFLIGYYKGKKEYFEKIRH